MIVTANILKITLAPMHLESNKHSSYTHQILCIRFSVGNDNSNSSSKQTVQMRKKFVDTYDGF